MPEAAVDLGAAADAPALGVGDGGRAERGGQAPVAVLRHHLLEREGLHRVGVDPRALLHHHDPAPGPGEHGRGAPRRRRRSRSRGPRSSRFVMRAGVRNRLVAARARRRARGSGAAARTGARGRAGSSPSRVEKCAVRPTGPRRCRAAGPRRRAPATPRPCPARRCSGMAPERLVDVGLDLGPQALVEVGGERRDHLALEPQHGAVSLEVDPPARRIVRDPESTAPTVTGRRATVYDRAHRRVDFLTAAPCGRPRTAPGDTGGSWGGPPRHPADARAPRAGGRVRRRDGRRQVHADGRQRASSS